MSDDKLMPPLALARPSCVGARAAASRQPAGNSPRITRSNSARSAAGSAATRACHAACSLRERWPAARHAPSTSARHLERRMRPVERLARRGGVGLEQPRAVAAALALQARDAARDHGAAGQHRRPRVGARRVERRRHGLDVVAVELHHMPAGHAKARGHVFADRQRRCCRRR